jgi:hypothetical protein
MGVTVFDAPPYLIAVCEGDQCKPIVAIADPDGQDGDLAAAQISLLAILTVVASTLRTRGVLGCLILLNGESGELIAKRRIWP